MYNNRWCTMNEERTTDADSGNGFSAPHATLQETWATRGELTELDGLLKHFVELAEVLTNYSVESKLADAMAEGMRSYQMFAA